MQSHQRTTFSHRYLIVSIFAIVVFFLAYNTFDVLQAPIASDWYIVDVAFVILPAIVIFLSVVLAIKYKARKDHGIAWILFSVSAVLWFSAEQAFSYEGYDLADPTTFAADALYMAGYAFYFGFVLYYLRPFKKSVTKRVVIASTVISAVMLAPSIYTEFLFGQDAHYWEILLSISYPVLNSLVLIPSLVGVYLFFRGKVNLLWSLLMFSWIAEIIAEMLYIGSYFDDSYFPGHISNVFYLIGYVLAAFGLYHYIRIHPKRSDLS